MTFRLSTLTVAVAMALAAGATFAQNSSAVTRSGQSNKATVTQTGDARSNTSTIVQEGVDSTASVTQVKETGSITNIDASGSTNKAIVIQQGGGHYTEIDQVSSTDNDVSVEQTGVALFGQIHDAGIEHSIAVMQRGISNKVSVTQGQGSVSNSKVTVEHEPGNSESTVVQAPDTQGSTVKVEQTGILSVAIEPTMQQESGVGHTADVTQSGGSSNAVIYQNGGQNITAAFQEGWGMVLSDILQDDLKLTATVRQIGEIATFQIEQKSSFQVAIVEQIAPSAEIVESKIFQIGGPQNHAEIEQNGDSSLSSLWTQDGSNHKVYVDEFGVSAESEILQQGSGTIVSVYQKNDGSVSTIGQMGDMSYVSVAQGGMATSAVTQLGKSNPVMVSHSF